MSGTLTPRKAVASADYEQRLATVPKLSKAEKAKRLQAVLADEHNGMKRLGQGMIGPIQLRLRYEGITRNVLVEDTLERGPLMPYDVLDDLGQAYVLNSTDAEVKIQVFEGKQVFPNLFRIASFPRVRKEDLMFLRVNIIEYAQDESRQAIQKQEDAKVIALFETAIINFGTAAQTPYGGRRTGITAGPASHNDEKTVLIGDSNPLEPQDFYSAVAMVEIDMLEASRVLIHPADARDFYTWDTNVTGWAFKDKVFAGERVTQFGEFSIQKSVMVPQGEIFLAADPNFVGVFPVMYSLDVEENHQIEQFYRGWVMDELVGMLVLNPRGLARIVKLTDYSDVDGSDGITKYAQTVNASTTPAAIENLGLYYGTLGGTE